MQYTYFTPIPATPEEAKARYRQLAHIHHPDKGGSTQAMQAVNAEYAALLAELTKHAERARQSKAHCEGKKTNADFIDLDGVAENLKVKIEELLNLDADIEIELIGLWIWVTGNTRAVKDQLKAMGLHWRPQKLAWSFEGVPSMNRSPKPLDDIRAMYGSTKFEKRQNQRTEDALPA